MAESLAGVPRAGGSGGRRSGRSRWLTELLLATGLGIGLALTPPRPLVPAESDVRLAVGADHPVVSPAGVVTPSVLPETSRPIERQQPVLPDELAPPPADLGPDRPRATESSRLSLPRPIAVVAVWPPAGATQSPVREKVIHVSLSEQTVRLTENGEVVLTTLAATGVRGAETPVGEFRVAVKLPTAHFRGINPSGRAYDIPDVPWVLPFLGDYTIHGAPWREGFGAPQSNGCVSLPTEVAEVVYDWAEVGTVVRVHE